MLDQIFLVNPPGFCGWVYKTRFPSYFEVWSTTKTDYHSIFLLHHREGPKTRFLQISLNICILAHF